MNAYDRAFLAIRLPLTYEQWNTLPRNHAYKYEFIDGQALLTPRPHGRSCVLRLGESTLGSLRPPSGEAHVVRQIEEVDWDVLPRVMTAAFYKEPPLACLPEGERLTAARLIMEETREGKIDGPLIPEACVVIASEKRRDVFGAAMVTRTSSRKLAKSWAFEQAESAGADDVCHLTWLFVALAAQRRGAGMALLAGAASRLRAMGEDSLYSTTLVGSGASTLWHWRAGFTLL